MADSSHSLSRLWLRQRRNDGVAHITYGCRHSWSNSLCGLSSQYLHSDEGVSSVCSVCSAAWQAADVRVMLPRGDVFVLDGRSGSLQRGPFFGARNVGRMRLLVTCIRFRLSLLARWGSWRFRGEPMGFFMATGGAPGMSNLLWNQFLSPWVKIV